MTDALQLREVTDHDLSIFFEQLRDPVACHMAAFTAKDPADRDAFMAHWAKIRRDDTIVIRTITVAGEAVGHVLSFEQFAEREVSYWIGRDYWGRGLATRALAEFLCQVKFRPLYARVARDNFASRRVLEKCGFILVGEDKGFANARDEEIEEYVLKLDRPEEGAAP